MTNILWISRHQMTTEQLLELQEAYGQDIHIEQVDRTIASVSSLSEDLAKADVVAAVLPTEQLNELVHMAGKRPVLVSVSGRVPTGREICNANGTMEQEYAFRHICWKVIRKMEYECEPLIRDRQA